MNRRKLLNSIRKVPPQVNYIISETFLNSTMLYGKLYKDYQNKLLANYKFYDNKHDLINLVNTAILNVPYYREKYKNLVIKSIDDFQKNIGFIDKGEINKNFKFFFSDVENIDQYDLLTTGGTSGTPLKLYLPKNRYIQELATLHFIWHNAIGFKNEFKAVLKNHKLNGKTYRVDPITKEFIFDGFTFTNHYFDKIYAVLKKYKIKYLLCYPSSGYEFCKYVYTSGKDFSFLKAIIASSENTYNFQMKLFIEKMGLKFFTWYGHTEKLVCAGYCANANYYHVEPTYGYCELLDEYNNPVMHKGQIGEIVGTTLHNYGMPLIRYRTGDFAEFLANECPHCGRKVTLFKTILGRWKGDRIYTNDGTYVTTTALNLHDEHYLVLDGIQYFQERKGELEVRIIPNNKFTENHKISLVQHFESIFKNKMIINIKEVNYLEKLPNGKFLLLLSKIPDNDA